MSKTILIADDDPHIREVVCYALEKAGMIVVEAIDGAQVPARFKQSNADLIILDINMPEKDGFEVCKEIRKTSEVPILFLSSRDEEIDRIIGLELGADDYLTKPFSPRELVARVKAILKRTYPINGSKGEANFYEVGLLRIEPDKHKVLWDGRDIDLTATEFSILQGMAQHSERVFDRDQIMSMAYDVNINVSDRTIDSHIRNLRHKFAEKGCDNIIQTVHGVGYKLTQ